LSFQTELVELQGKNSSILCQYCLFPKVNIWIQGESFWWLVTEEIYLKKKIFSEKRIFSWTTSNHCKFFRKNKKMPKIITNKLLSKKSDIFLRCNNKKLINLEMLFCIIFFDIYFLRKLGIRLVGKIFETK
jgi:hypothetical protein